MASSLQCPNHLLKSNLLKLAFNLFCDLIFLIYYFTHTRVPLWHIPPCLNIWTHLTLLPSGVLENLCSDQMCSGKQCLAHQPSPSPCPAPNGAWNNVGCVAEQRTGQGTSRGVGALPSLFLGGPLSGSATGSDGRHHWCSARDICPPQGQW